MLVLKRCVGEKIIISGGIAITVVDVSGGFCRLGIDAPRSVAVDREEVYLSKLSNERTGGQKDGDETGEQPGEVQGDQAPVE